MISQIKDQLQTNRKEGKGKEKAKGNALDYAGENIICLNAIM